MKKISILLIEFLFFTSIIHAQNETKAKYAYCKKIDSNYKIVFLKNDQGSKLLAEPRIVFKDKTIEIKEFDETNFSSKSLKISKNKKYLVMDYIIKGYVQTENDSILHENYSCIILDIRNANIVMQLQSDCDGRWNNNDWISDEKILFVGNK